MDKGYGKRTNLTITSPGRGGSGIKTAKVTDKTGKIVMAMVVNAKENAICWRSRTTARSSASGRSISVLGRDNQGVRIHEIQGREGRHRFGDARVIAPTRGQFRSGGSRLKRSRPRLRYRRLLSRPKLC